MEISYSKGILLKHQGKKLLIDPEISKTSLAIPTIVTHAHSDHTAAITSNSQTYTTQQTVDLFEVAQPKKYSRKIHPVDFYTPFEIDGFEIELVKAGHLLGAGQVIVRCGNESVHFTGDFCPEPLLTVEGADIPKDVDISILDATYGDEKIHFEDRLNERQRLLVWILSTIKDTKVPLVNIAHLGGAQELIKFLNQVAPNLEIFVHPNIAIVNEIYSKYDVKLKYRILESNIKIDDKSVVLIPRARNKIEYVTETTNLTPNNMRRGIVTGQTAKYNFNSYDFSSNLSTHASHNELLETTLQIQPSQVLTYYGYPEQLAYSINYNCDIPAMELKNCQALQVKKVKSRSNVKIDHRNYFENSKSENEKLWEDWYETK
jgi:Cft2 family RNA processing exonuclease